MNRAVLVVMLWAGTSFADVPPADSVGCREKTEGASCKRDDGSDGSCAKATCSRNDYSEGPPPKSVKYECLKCGAAAEPPAEKKSCAAVPGETILALAALIALRRRS